MHVIIEWIVIHIYLLQIPTHLHSSEKRSWFKIETLSPDNRSSRRHWKPCPYHQDLPGQIQAQNLFHQRSIYTNMRTLILESLQHVQKIFSIKTAFAWQFEIGAAVLCGKDVIVDVGMGSGKMLSFSIPLVMHETDVALRVTPLTALMMDQVQDICTTETTEFITVLQTNSLMSNSLSSPSASPQLISSCLPPSEGSNVLQFKWNTNDAINTTVSFRYFMNLEADMARHKWGHENASDNKRQETCQTQVSPSGHSPWVAGPSKSTNCYVQWNISQM